MNITLFAAFFVYLKSTRNFRVITYRAERFIELRALRDAWYIMPGDYRPSV
jgi:hypothetical protein